MASHDEEVDSPRMGSSKDVTFSETPEAISPMLLGQGFASPPQAAQSKRFRTHLGSRRLSGRPSVERMSPSLINEAHSSLVDSGYYQSSGRPSLHRHNSSEGHHGLLSQVTAWIEKEKSRRQERKQREDRTSTVVPELNGREETSGNEEPGSRRGSMSSDGSAALEELEQMVQKSLTLENKRSSHSSRRHSSAKKLKPDALSSDTEYQDGDAVVPTCDAVLDNSKVLGYDDDEEDDEQSDTEPASAESKSNKKIQDREARSIFKYEIVRLAHTLRLKGWRRVPLESSGAIKCQRLSGALTNAVYVVSPPSDPHLLSRTNSRKDDGKDGTQSAPPKPVPRLLLRIYGPQVEHLIDRDAELQILKRLARKKIGPRLLGTFANGRFEEFLNADPLTAEELRIPETSKAIAKRFRELHDGIELLDREKEAGPFVWNNWEKWVQRCTRIATWLDGRVDEYRNMDDHRRGSITGQTWVERGYVVGTTWAFFRRAVEKFRSMLEEKYGGVEKIKEKMVFCHNDAQYGNILRIKPPGESPLLLPANMHRQLVVIDFEYARQNVIALDFANHFTEWCYNYHDDQPHAINVSNFPSVPEQRRFIKAYLEHRWTPPSHMKTPTMSPQNSTPRMSASSGPGSPPSTITAPTAPRPTALGHHPADSSSSSISTLMLDHSSHSRSSSLTYAPDRGGPVEDDRSNKDQENYEAQIELLLTETRLWRVANSVLWVAWGIVQATVPGMPASVVQGDGAAAGLQPVGEEFWTGEDDVEEDFDYLGYARDRALFFWGDLVQLGVVSREELPADVREQLKIVPF